MNIYYSLYPLPLFFPLSLKNFLSSSASLSLNLLTFIFTSFYKTHSSSLSIKCVSFLSNIIFSHPLFYFNTHFSLSLFLSLSTIHFSIPLLHLFLSNILISFITLFTKPILQINSCHSQLLYWAATDRKRKVKETLNHCRKPQLFPQKLAPGIKLIPRN